MAQLAEWMLLTPEDLGLNPAISNFHKKNENLLLTVNKMKIGKGAIIANYDENLIILPDIPTAVNLL